MRTTILIVLLKKGLKRGNLGQLDLICLLDQVLIILILLMICQLALLDLIDLIASLVH